MHWHDLVGDAPAERVHDATNDVRVHGEFVVKFPGLLAGLGEGPPELQLLVEHLAYRVYARFGVRVPPAQLVHDGRRLGLATARVRGPSVGAYLRSRGLDLAQLDELGPARDVYAGFFVDVLLANWDVIGLTGDNLVLGADGIYRIDPGGALTFRARGERKGSAFASYPGELTTMRDPRLGTAGEVFGPMSAGEEAHAAEVFLRVPWPELRAGLEEVREEVNAALGGLTGPQRDELGRAADREFDEITPRLASRLEAIRCHLREAERAPPG